MNTVDNITKQSVYNSHQQQLSNGQDNNEKVLEIVAALGGIDMILADYLRENIAEDRITMSDLIQINYIIEKQNRCEQYQQNKLQPLSVLRNKKSKFDWLDSDEDNDKYSIRMLLYPYDNILNSFMSEKHTQTILNILHHPIVKSLVVLSVPMYFILRSSFIANIWVNPLYKIIISLFLWIPFPVFWILSSNTKAFKLLIRSFEFWFKFVYACIWGIFDTIYGYHIVFDAYGNNNRPYAFTNFLSKAIVNIFVIPLLVFCTSSFDAVKTSKRWQIAMSALMGLVFTYWAIHYSILLDQDDDYTIIVPATNGLISMQAQISSAARILAIFFFKQAIAIWRHGRREKCVIIKYHPYIKWWQEKEKVNGKGNTEMVKVVDV